MRGRSRVLVASPLCLISHASYLIPHASCLMPRAWCLSTRVLAMPASPITHRIRLPERRVLDEGAIHFEVAAHDVVRLNEPSAQIDGDGAPELCGGGGCLAEEAREVVHRDREHFRRRDRAE